MDSGLSLREPRNVEFFRFHEFVKSKIIACLVGQITGTAPLTPRRPKGTDRDRHETLGAGCDGRSVSKANGSAAYGEVVWSWRRDAGVKPVGFFRR